MGVDHMENNEKKKPDRGNQKNYYRKPKNKPKTTGEKPVKQFNKKTRHTKPVKVKKLSEETVADILKDIDRIEKEIELEIKEIQSTKLSF
jgi:hypothetical protein